LGVVLALATAPPRTQPRELASLLAAEHDHHDRAGCSGGSLTRRQRDADQPCQPSAVSRRRSEPSSDSNINVEVWLVPPASLAV
jgi:hypothetical protein